MKEIIKKSIVFLLTKEAQCALKKHKPKVIAITGSVGKTSAKDSTYTILEPFFDSIRKSEKSFNSNVGVPLSILGLPNAWGNIFGWIVNICNGFLGLFKKEFPNPIILEVGADHKNDISSIASWLRPDYAVLTRLPKVPVHIEFFSSRDEVVEEKKSLLRYVKNTGVIILNADDEEVFALKDNYTQKVLTYGVHPDADLRMTDIRVQKKDDTYEFCCNILYKENKKSISVSGLISETQIMSALPGILIGLEEHLSFDELTERISLLKPTPGRLSLVPGIHSSILIDDTYNSSPTAVAQALSVLKSLPESKRRIAMLGDMLELGKYTEDEHRKAGRYSVKCVDMLITVGIRSKFTQEEAQKSGLKNSFWFDTSEHAGEFLFNQIKKGDVILLKGSQSIRMEHAAKILMADPNNAKKILVRQDEEWQKR